MILDLVREPLQLAPQPSTCNASSQHGNASRQGGNASRPLTRGHSLVGCAGINLATVCLAIAGVVAIAPSALSQSDFNQKTARSIPDATVQHSTCVNDSQGLMCNSSRSDVDSATASATTVDTTTANSATLPALSDAQMERLSDVLLGLLYFVLPIGFGLTLFLHDRHQADRAAALETQIKLLEKLWDQSPQA